MNMDERIEAGKAIYKWCRERALSAGETVFRVAEAMYPELSGDKPTHWLAPMEDPNEAFEELGRVSLIESLFWEDLRAYLGKGDGG